MKRLLQMIHGMEKRVQGGLRTYPDNYPLFQASKIFLLRLAEFSRRTMQQWEREGKLHSRPCPLCSHATTVLALDKRDSDGIRYSRCQQCHFVFLDPSPVEEDYNKIYETGFDGLDEWWQKKKADHGIGDDTFEYPILDTLRNYVPSGKFLDFGCGTGWVLKNVAGTYDGWGVDIDRQRLETARRVTRLGEKIQDFRTLDRNSFLSSFEVIHSNQNLEHLLDPLAYLELFKSWLKPGGVLYFSCPASDSFAWNFLREDNSMAMLPHVSMFNEDSLRFIIRKLGFTLLELNFAFRDVSGMEFWSRILGHHILHRHQYVRNPQAYQILKIPMAATEIGLTLLEKGGVLKGNYFSCLVRKV